MGFIVRKIPYFNDQNQELFEMELVSGELPEPPDGVPVPRFGINLAAQTQRGMIQVTVPVFGDTVDEAFQNYPDAVKAGMGQLNAIAQKVNSQIAIANSIPSAGIANGPNGGIVFDPTAFTKRR